MCDSQVLLSSSYVCSRSHDFLTVFTVAQKSNQIASFLDDDVRSHLIFY